MSSRIWSTLMKMVVIVVHVVKGRVDDLEGLLPFVKM